jgi:putative Holliday junction resolvase
MGRILAIDFGFKRSGLAITDPMQMIASPHETISSRDLLSYIRSYSAKEPLDAIVIGMPKNLKGKDTDTTAAVTKFIKLLKKALPDIPVYEEDERFTSAIAHREMISGGMSKKDRRVKGNVDKISATLILQSFLERRQR